MTDFPNMIAADDALRAAQRGDLEPLALRVEAGKLSPQEGLWLAGYLRGEYKQVRGRPKGRLWAKPDTHQTLASQFKARFAVNRRSIGTPYRRAKGTPLRL